ncbi:MAG TPA: PEGA domain-containing protein [Dehalococcoidia bacterium]|nr:PEGA domain-containing protein [Dehalococcoidia bacterium]
MVKKLLLTSFALALVGSLAMPATANAQWIVRGGFGYGWGYPYGWGWGPYWGYGYGWGPYAWGPWGYPGYYGYGYYGGWASLRIQVQPKTAEVFVDGSPAGIVDHFDSWYQSLNVAPGQHDIAIYMDGYRTLHRNMYLPPASSQSIKLVLEKLAPGEPQEPRPRPMPPPEDRQQDSPVRPGQPGYPRGGQPPHDVEVRPGQPPPPQEAAPNARFGTLSLRIQPADAEVFVDGHSWTGAATDSRLSIRLSAGRHHIEVRKAGFETYTEDVLIRPDITMTLNVGLTRR